MMNIKRIEVVQMLVLLAYIALLAVLIFFMGKQFQLSRIEWACREHNGFSGSIEQTHKKYYHCTRVE